jgi:Flp pilus assembly protein TadG
MTSIIRSKAERGQSLVEVALTFPILLLILSGMIDLGRLYFTYVALEDVVGEAALYLSINPDCRYETDGAACANPNNAYFRAKAAAGWEVDWTKVTLVLDSPPIHGVGDPVKASLKYSFLLMTPLFPKTGGLNQMQLSTLATQIIVSE